MRLSFLLMVIPLLLTVHAMGQRMSRYPKSTEAIVPVDSLPPKYIKVTVSNNDTIPVFLKSGMRSRIANNDTVDLEMTTDYCGSVPRNFYDLHFISLYKNSCIVWYSLQLIKPKEQIRFYIKFKNFNQTNQARLCYSFTKEITDSDRVHNMYADHTKIYLQRDGHSFQTKYIVLDKLLTDISLIL